MKHKYPCPKCKTGHLVKDGHTENADRKQRWSCKDRNSKYCYTTVDPTAPYRDQAGTKKRPQVDPLFKRALGGTKRYVVTCAQNATPVHQGFFDSLTTYCEKHHAELLVIPTRYKNPTSQWTESQANADFWLVPKDVLYNQRWNVNDNLTIMGDLKTQPTAVDPLTGFEAITGSRSGIFGHPKLRLKTVATPQGTLPKILTTTGACTLPNYVNSRAGKTGEFHHVLGATLVEVHGKTFHMRQLLGENKSGVFCDLAEVYSPAGVLPAARPLSLTMGDTHVADIDPLVEHATFKEIVPALKPLALVYHDLVSGLSHNHHTERNPFVSIARAFEGNSSVAKEINDALQFVADRLQHVAQAVIVPSNHNDWLHFWLMNSDWRTMNPFNRMFYLRTALALVEKASLGGTQDAERLNAFIELARARFADNAKVRVLEYDESCMLGEIEHGMHGHLGPNGSRGNIRNLRRIGVKSNTGHVHTPGIDEGAWSAGTSTKLRLGYNRGPSGWLNTHILTYANSKRTFINIIKGDWRA